MARPAKADPDVIRLQERYLLTYGRARLLKAFSYGVALRHDLLLYLLGDDAAPIRCMGDAFEGIRRRVPRFRPRAIGHTDALYVLEDQALIEEIRAAMEGSQHGPQKDKPHRDPLFRDPRYPEHRREGNPLMAQGEGMA
jgi:hypothetical protein